MSGDPISPTGQPDQPPAGSGPIDAAAASPQPLGLRCHALADLSLLRASWDDVLAHDRQDGALGAAVSRFALDPDTSLVDISTTLTAGTWRPQALSRVEIPREDGRPRLLHVPAVRDRVVERAALRLLTPIIDPLLEACSFAYRPGLGVADAVQEVVRLRDEGLTWAARADIRDCFPSIGVGRVLRLADALVTDPELLDVVRALLTRVTWGPGGRRPLRGLAQGTPMAPMWANLVLSDLDDRVIGAGFPIVRYADDFAVLAASRDEAWEAMRVASQAAEGLGLRLGAEKSQVMSFDEGFTFLGEDFGPRYPPTLTDHRVVEPDRRVLYVGLQGSRVRVEGGRVVVESPDDQELLDVPSGQLARLVCFGSIGVSAGFRSWALLNGVDQVFCSRRGSYLGSLPGHPVSARTARLRAQLRAADDHPRRILLGRAIVTAKIRKQVVVLRRLARRENAEVVAEATGLIEQLLPLVDRADEIDALMGVEGAAARAYFSAVGAIMPEGLQFQTRSRQPPQDTVNAALSFGYTLLAGEAVSALAAAGLDPAIGMLHAEADRRPSLALDLMEDFRPLIVDQVVLAMVNRGELRPEHGRRQEGVSGVLLTRAGRAALVSAYERRMQQFTRGALSDFSGTLRRHLYRQAQRLATFIHDDTELAGSAHETWTGLSWR